MAKRVIMVGIDACHRDTLYKLIDTGKAPFFKSLADNGTRVKNAVTMFPSTTGSCCATLYTGCWYRNHGILNNEWVDRFVTPVRGRSYLENLHEALHSMDRKLFGLPTLFLPERKSGGQINNDLNPEHPTIFETLTAAGKTSYSFFHYYGKGATRWIRPSRMDMVRYGYVEQFKKPFQIYEKYLVTRAIHHIRDKMPDLLAIYFGCNDGHSHRFGVEAQYDYLKDFIDPQLKRLKDAYDELCPNDEVYWSICADHGQSTVKEEEKHRSMWYDTFYPAFHEAGITKIDRGLSKNVLDDLDAIVTLGTGASVGFYVKDKKTADWKNAPDFEKDVAPILNNLMKASDQLGPFKDWAWPGYLDFILARKSFKDPYMIYANEPPYDKPGRLMPLEEFFKGKDSIYVKPLERIRGIDSPKGPDFIVVLDYIEKHFNINEIGGFHPGQHGSFCPDDSYVPMIFSGPGIKKGEIDEAFTTNWSPTIASIFGLEIKGADGKPLTIF